MGTNGLNPKVYPHMFELCKQLVAHYEGLELTELVDPWAQPCLNLHKQLKVSLTELKEKLPEYDYFISVDTFLPHMINTENINVPGIVIFSYSDPKIFGYPQNLNVYNDPKLFRENQFEFWVPQAIPNYIDPKLLFKKIKAFIK